MDTHHYGRSSASPIDLTRGKPQKFASTGRKRITESERDTALVHCWYKGKPAYYIQTDASDESFASQQGVNFVPQLANAIAGGAVDDIYHATNFNQGNVIPSDPIPAGPRNSDPNYTPLWRLAL